MTFEALRDRRISLRTAGAGLRPCRRRWSPPSSAWCPGTRLTVEEAILGLVTKSANDAAAALGELLGGSEDRFAQMMTLRARALGMNRTTFTNASGLPDPDAVDHRARPGDPGAPPADRLPRVLSVFQHAQLHLPASRDLQPRPHAAVLSRRGRHEDRLHRGVRPQSRHQRRAQRRAPDRRRAGRRLPTPSATSTWRHCSTRGSSRWTCRPSTGPTVASRAAQPDRHRACRDRDGAADPTGVAYRAITAAWAIQVGSFGNERAARDAAANARRAADGGEARVEPASQHGRTVWRAQVIGLTAARRRVPARRWRRHRAACS